MSLEVLVALCKKRGFIFQSSALYGGLQGFFDYGPLGVELKNNIKKIWWEDIVLKKENVFGLDSATILNPKVLEQSGHKDTFTDPLKDCLDCKSRFRTDEIKNDECPKCKSKKLSEERKFNLMMKTNLGPLESENGSEGFLRPETAQGIFINFKNICDTFSPKLPFGIAQTGKAYRNEITPRNFTFRTREFEQMEMEYFVLPDQADKTMDEIVAERINWWKKLGIEVQAKEQTQEELAHYAKKTVDLIFKFPHSDEELEGICNRTDFDLGSHTKAQAEFDIQAKVKENKTSTQKLAYLNEEKKWIVPFIIETSAGLDRAVLAALQSAYNEEQLEEGKSRIVLKFKKEIAPIKAAIIPLVKNNEEIQKLARKTLNFLKENKVMQVVLENTGNIGKAYRKHDEIGTPYCITIDHESIESSLESGIESVTVRNRDTMKQERVKLDKLLEYLGY